MRGKQAYYMHDGGAALHVVTYLPTVRMISMLTIGQQHNWALGTNGTANVERDWAEPISSSKDRFHLLGQRPCRGHEDGGRVCGPSNRVAAGYPGYRIRMSIAPDLGYLDTVVL